MNMAEWIRDLPSHIIEALRSLGFDRRGFSLRRLLLSLLLLLSGIATGLGLLALVKANTGEIGLIESFVVVVLAVGAVVTMWIALEQAMVSVTWRGRSACIAVYLFFALWSIAFGYGFYWNRLASMDVAQNQIEGTVSAVAKNLNTASNRLGGVRERIRGAEEYALVSMKQERDGGGGCEGVQSGRGGGNLCKARFAMTQAIHTEASGLVEWSGGGKGMPDLNQVSCDEKYMDAAAPKVDFGPSPLQADIERLQQQGLDIERGAGSSTPTQLAQRYADYSAMATKTLAKVDGILRGAPDRAPQLRDLEKRIAAGYERGGEICRDSTLAANIGALAETLEQVEPLDVKLPELNVGEKATKVAFMRLYDNALQFPGWLLGLSKMTAQPLDNRDMIALIAAIAVDIAIFFLSILCHNASPFQRITSVFTLPMDAAELRRGLMAVVRADPDFFARFGEALAIHRGRYYLVTSPDLPEFYGSISNAIIMLHAAGLGEIRHPTDLALRRLTRDRRDAFLNALRAPLLASVARLGDAGRPIGDEDLFAIELPPRVVQAINLLLGAQPHEGEGVAAEPDGPDRPGGAAAADAPRAPDIAPGASRFAHEAEDFDPEPPTPHDPDEDDSPPAAPAGPPEQPPAGGPYAQRAPTEGE